jgi:hypothetical protein
MARQSGPPPCSTSSSCSKMSRRGSRQSSSSSSSSSSLSQHGQGKSTSARDRPGSSSAVRTHSHDPAHLHCCRGAQRTRSRGFPAGRPGGAGRRARRYQDHRGATTKPPSRVQASILQGARLGAGWVKGTSAARTDDGLGRVDTRIGRAKRTAVITTSTCSSGDARTGPASDNGKRALPCWDEHAWPGSRLKDRRGAGGMHVGWGPCASSADLSRARPTRKEKAAKKMAPPPFQFRGGALLFSGLQP